MWVIRVKLNASLHALDDLPRQELLLILLVVLRRNVVVSLFDVLSEMEQLNTELLDEHVVLDLSLTWGGAALALEQVRDQ
jgi:hypothetical protein